MILHILWLILKFIGIALAVILGLLVLAVCIVVFVPVRYRAALSCLGTKESLTGEIKVSWLFPLVSMRVLIEGTDVRTVVRIAWKKLGGSPKEMKEEEPRYQKSSDCLEEAAERSEKPDDAKASEIRSEQQGREQIEMKEQKPVPIEEKLPEPEEAKKKRDPFGFFKKIRNGIAGIWEKIKCTIKKICDSIELLSEKKDKMVSFLEDEVHRAAFSKTLTEVKRILIVLKPAKVKGNITFGFSDPCTTGQVLAVLGMLYPFLEKTLGVTPEFEQKVFKGDIYIKGKMRTGTFLRSGMVLLVDKRFRSTIKAIRNFKL